MRHPISTIVAVCVVFVGLLRSSLGAHEIPADVTIHAFVRPEGQVARMAIRVPLETFRDIIIPLRGETTLDLTRADSAVRAGIDLWILSGVRLFEEGTPTVAPRVVAARIALPSDRSFESWETAIAGFSEPRLPDDTNLPWTQALVDVLLEFPISSDRSRLAMETEFARLGLRTRTVLRFQLPAQPERVIQFIGDAGRLELDPRWHEAARRFVVSGIEHILVGVDHLLFVLCLVIPVRRFRSLILLVTAFTVGHSITLISASAGWVPEGFWFPPLVETAIAASIVWMALENIVGAARADGVAPGQDRLSRRWLLTALFGLIHGFGFSFILSESLQFGGSHLVTSLVAFNLGVELGQLLALAVMVPALWALFRYVVGEKIGAILISAIVAHQAWHWMEERFADLMTHDIPAPSSAFWVWTLRIGVVVWLGVGVWLLRMRRLGAGEMGR